MEREVGVGIGMGNTCKPMAVSFQCMTKPTTDKNNNNNKKNNPLSGKKKKRCGVMAFNQRLNSDISVSSLLLNEMKGKYTGNWLKS